MRTYRRSSPNRLALLTWMSDVEFKDRFPWLSETVFFAIFGLIPILVGCGSGVRISVASSLLSSPGTLDFGDVSLGQSSVKTIVLSNTGKATVSVSQISFSSPAFSIVNAGSFPITISAGSSRSILVGFNPTAATDYSAQILVVDSTAKQLAQVAIHGRGTNSAQLIAQMSVSASRLDFGSVTAGSPTIQALTLTSAGTSPVTISSVTISGAGFSLVGGSIPATLNPNQSLTLQVQFSPTATGVANGQLTIISNSATGSKAMVVLSGTSTAAPSPQLTLSAGSLSFSNVTVNTSTTQMLTLTSTGTSPVTLSAATISGAGFSLVGWNWPTTLNPNQTLTLQVQFNPTAIGAASGALIVNSNSAAGGTVAIPLIGTSVAAPSPQLTVSVGSLSFGNVTVNASTTQVITLSSTGTSPVVVNSMMISGSGFAVLGGSVPATLNPGQTMVLQVRFSPTFTGAATGRLTIASNSSTGSTTIIALTGTGAAAPYGQLTISATALSFGNITVNTSTTQTITLTSTGTASVTVDSVTISGTGFALVGTSLPATLSPGQTMVLQIRFNPTATGGASGQLTISSSSAAGTAVVTISGTGTVAPNPQLTVNPGNIAFGNVAVNTAATQFLTLTSTGTSAVTISSATIFGSGFKLVSGGLPVTLNPTQSLTLQVQFSPAATGVSVGQLRIDSDATGSSVMNLVLSGTGMAGSLQLRASTGTLSFGNQSVNTATRKTLTLTSTGTSPVTVSSAAVSGIGFTLVGGSFPVTLNPSQTLTLQIQFLATTNGAQTGHLTVVSDSTGGDLVVALSGTGTGASPEVDLSWDAPTSSPVTLMGYRIYRSTGSSGSFNVINSTSVGTVVYIDKTVVSGNSYSYLVKSVDASNTESTPSNQISVSIP